MSAHKTILKDININLVSTFAVNVLNLLRNIILARMLGPYITGLCVSLLSIPQAAGYLNLGLIDALAFIVPQRRGSGQAGSLPALKTRVFTASLLIALAASCASAGFVFFSSYRHSTLAVHLYCAISLIMLMFMTKFLCTNLAGERRFVMLAAAELVYSLLLFGSSIVFVLLKGNLGFWLGLITANAALIVIWLFDYVRHEPLRLNLPHFQELRRWVPLGIVMSISVSLYLPFVIIGKVFLGAAVGVVEVGYFALSIFILSTFAVIPRTFSRVLLPHLTHIHSASPSTENGLLLFWKTQGYLVVLVLAGVLAGFALIKPVTLWFLPKYAKGIFAARIMLIAIVPYSLIDNANNIFIVLRRKRTCLKILSVCLVMQICLFLGLLWWGVTLNRVSCSYIVVFTFYAAWLHWEVLRLQREMKGKVAVCPP